MKKIRRILFVVFMFVPLGYSFLNYISSWSISQINDFSLFYDSVMYFKFEIFYEPLREMIQLINGIVPDGLQIILALTSYYIVLVLIFIVLELVCFFTDLAFRELKRGGL